MKTPVPLPTRQRQMRARHAAAKLKTQRRAEKAHNNRTQLLQVRAVLKKSRAAESELKQKLRATQSEISMKDQELTSASQEITRLRRLLTGYRELGEPLPAQLEIEGEQTPTPCL
jgi:hypothetical protein